jgi:hypothetical protein
LWSNLCPPPVVSSRFAPLHSAFLIRAFEGVLRNKFVNIVIIKLLAKLRVLLKPSGGSGVCLGQLRLWSVPNKLTGKLLFKCFNIRLYCKPPEDGKTPGFVVRQSVPMRVFPVQCRQTMLMYHQYRFTCQFLCCPSALPILEFN